MKTAEEFFDQHKRAGSYTRLHYMDFAELYADYVVAYEKQVDRSLTMQLLAIAAPRTQAESEARGIA